MNEKKLVWDQLRDLLMKQRFGVVATHSNGKPYTSLVAFAATDDLRDLIFVTSNETRKFKNIISNANAAMMIDNRSNTESDISSAFAATACGTCRVIEKAQSQSLIDLYVKKHPELREFILSPSSALIDLQIETYYFVKRFQQVFELKIS